VSEHRNALERSAPDAFIAIAHQPPMSGPSFLPPTPASELSHMVVSCLATSESLQETRKPNHRSRFAAIEILAASDPDKK
jgi:hypothetical protein